MSPLLWRVEGTSAAPQHAGWQQGLTLHLLFQPLTLIVARREGQSRYYLALNGCPSCRPDGCDRVCHRVLFEQLVHTTLPGVTLVPTPRLVSRASETRRIAATPNGANARPLGEAFLTQWTEGRLIITWSRLQAKPQPVRVGALLAVGQQGPDPRQALRAYGWSGSRTATLFHRVAFERTVPGVVPVGSRAGEALLHALRDPLSLTGAPQLSVAKAVVLEGGVGENQGQIIEDTLLATQSEER
jgi:hypothetical protein